jgi:hypothetical protein
MRNLLPRDIGPEETLGRIKRWIQECDSEHILCVPTPASGQFQGPKRILDLRFGTVKLREDLQEEYSYACLSHCVRARFRCPLS